MIIKITSGCQSQYGYTLAVLNSILHRIKQTIQQDKGPETGNKWIESLFTSHHYWIVSIGNKNYGPTDNREWTLHFQLRTCTEIAGYKNTNAGWLQVVLWYSECVLIVFHSCLAGSLVSHLWWGRLDPGVKHLYQRMVVEPCGWALAGVPLMALKMPTESDRVLLVPFSTGFICSCMMFDSSLVRSL